MSIEFRSFDDLLGKPFPAAPCPCGQTHIASTRGVLIEPGAIVRLPELLARCGLTGRPALLCDERTLPYAHRVAEHLPEPPLATLCARGDHLHADEHTVGTFALTVPRDAAYLIAVGSGTIQDATRYLAHQMRLPFLGIGTAPSMDGYASGVAAMTIGGAKVTLEATSPRGVLLDVDWMCQAPQPMIAAGLGDVAGKLTALADWRLGEWLTGETRCAAIEGLTRRAYAQCLGSADGLPVRDRDAVQALSEGLVLSGLCIQLYGTSRPASGAEHHISHLLEIMAMRRGEPVALHGDKVGMATLLIIDLYAAFFQGTPPPLRPIDEAAYQDGLRRCYGEDVAIESPDMPAPDVLHARMVACWDDLCALAASLAEERPRIEDAIARAGGPTTHAQMGIARADIRDALRYAHGIRPRFTIQWLLHSIGWLPDIADRILREGDA